MPNDTEVQQLMIYVGTQAKIDAAKQAGTITDNDFAVVTDAPDLQPLLTAQNAGTGISITMEGGIVKINNTQTSAEWGNITGTLSNQTDLQQALNGKQPVIIDLDTIRAGAGAGATALQPTDVVNNTTSTATDAPLSANMGKSLQDQVNNLNGRGRYLALWNCETGLAQSNPPQSPYTYKAGDYFIVGTVASAGGTDYRPTGSSYTTGVASTVVETEDVAVNDVYYYDGTNWSLQINTQKEVAFVNIAGDPYDNTNLASALNSKVTGNNAITGSTKCKITYDSKGLVTTGADLSAGDIPDLSSTYVKKDGGGSQQTIQLSSGSGTTALGLTSRTTSSYLSFSGTNGWLGSYGVSSDKNPTFYNGTSYTLAYTTDIPTNNNQLTNGAGYITSSALNGYATETWVGQQGYLTGITSSDVTTALGYTPYNGTTNPNGYTSNVGTVTSVNNVSPVNGDVTLSIPTVNNPTITITQGGVTKGSFTLNQSSGDTIALDAGGGSGANTDLSNLTVTGKKNAYKAVIPSASNALTNIVDSALLTTFRSYTAPAEGYFYVNCAKYNGAVEFYKNNQMMGYGGTAHTSDGDYFGVMIPCKTGDVISYHTTAGYGSIFYSAFYYAEGTI